MFILKLALLAAWAISWVYRIDRVDIIIADMRTKITTDFELHIVQFIEDSLVPIAVATATIELFVVCAVFYIISSLRDDAIRLWR